MIAASFFPVVTFLAAFTGDGASPLAYQGEVLWVIDGDTVQIAHAGAPKGEPVRARHYDTPEKGDRAHCDAERDLSRQASEAARRLMPRGAMIGLADLGRDRYGRLLATLTLPDGSDLAVRMIEAGLAVTYEGGRKQGWCDWSTPR